MRSPLTPPTGAFPSDDRHRRTKARRSSGFFRSYPDSAVAPNPATVAQLSALDERFRAFYTYARTVKNQSPASIVWYETSLRNFFTYLHTKLDLDPAAFA